MYREDIAQLARKRNKFRTLALTTASAIIMAGTVQVSIVHADEKQQINIGQTDLGAALLQIAQQRKVSIIYNPELLRGKKSSTVQGRFTTREVLQQLLSGSGYMVEEDNKGNFYIRKQSGKNSTRLKTDVKGVYASEKSDFRKISNEAGENYQDNLAVYEEDEKQDEFIELEEIVTTGSHIRGAKSASPVFIYDRKDIDKTGLSTLPQFMRTLPQVFGGGASDGNSGISGANSAGLNIGNGTGINLRGLGTGSTLVLLDGHRMAAAGFGEFVDISIIPLTAIERVEILPDGASAIYGSDAVGGVVNFRLREDYEGAETRVRYGTVTEGSSDELQIGQIFGKAWEGGNGLISYEYYQRSPLDSEDRSFTKDSPDPTDLLAKQIRHSIFVKAREALTEKIEIQGTAFYSSRESEQFIGNQFAPETSFTAARSQQYGATIGLQTSIGNSWQGELLGTYNQNKTSNPSQIFAVPFNPTDTPIREVEDQKISSDVRVLEAKADGTLFHIAGGDVKSAIGGQYRREQFEWPIISVNTNRDIYAIYGEIFAPLISDDNRRPGFERLEVTLAARYEHYSDFGSSTDPKFGLLWAPVNGFNLRGTYSTSFRAPLLQELSENNLSAFLLSIPDPDKPAQNIPGLLVFGNNSALQPETASTWTAGFDIKPDSIPGLNISLTYFNIKFKSRIKDPGGFFDGFTDPKFAPLLTKNPDQAFIDFWTSIPDFFNFSSFDPADVEIVFNRQLRNIASVNTSGLDFSIFYNLDTNIGNFDFALNGTYLFEKDEQLLETTTPVDVIDTVNNPASIKINSSISWNRDGFATNIQITHIGPYKDVRVEPIVDVSSWTTIDLNLSYDTGDQYDSPWLENTVFSLSVQNLLDQDPPFVKGSSGANRNFDPDNATARGRFIAFQITRKW